MKLVLVHVPTFVICGIFIAATFSFLSSRHASNLVAQITTGYPENRNEATRYQIRLNVSLSDGYGSPILHVGFLKVHKAGSTTIQNLLFRFALRHNLTLLLPVRYCTITEPKEVLPLKNGNRYDILANHVQNWRDIFKLLPKDTVRVAIIRDPLERAISAAYYYRDVFHIPYLKRVPSTSFIETLIRFPQKYDKKTFSLTKNAMGADFLLQHNNSRLKYDLDRLRSEFQLVMVLEKLEESLILLRRMLDWSIQDIIFLSANTHSHASANLTEELRQKFRNTSFLDFAIYEYFVPILEAKIKAAGEDFREELSYFKKVLLKVKTFCRSHKSVLNISKSKWNLEFQLSDKECKLMKTRGAEFVRLMQERHQIMQN